MRINIVTGPFFSVPPAPAGAVEWVWFLLGKELAKRGHHVTLLARKSVAYHQDVETPNLAILRRGGFAQTNNIWIDLGKDMVYSFSQMLQLPPADFTITNAFWLPPVLLMRRSVGYIVPSINRYPKGQMGLYKHCAFIAPCSGAIARAIEEQYPALKPKIRLIPNVIDTQAFIPPKKARCYSGVKTILFTGRIHPEKGLHVLVDAFNLLCQQTSDLRLKIVGPWQTDRGGGGDEYLGKLRRIAGTLPVEFYNSISDRHKLAELCQSAHFYCYPSLAAKGEALPVAPIEAMATGLIPIVSNLACFDDYITDETGIRFERGADPAKNLRDALERAIRYPNLQSMSEAAAKMARRFSPEVVASTLEAACLQALHTARA